MSDERKKILEMVKDGVITVEEADELLKVLDSTVKKPFFKEKMRQDLLKTKEALLKAKERLVEEYEKIDFGKIKDNLKKGIDKIDKSIKKVDDAIIDCGRKIFKRKPNPEDKNMDLNYEIVEEK